MCSFCSFSALWPLRLHMWNKIFDISALRVTDWKRLLLYNQEGECSGPVYGLQDGKTQQVSGLGWGREEGQKLCKYLQCGNYTSHSTILKNTTEWWNKNYNCSGENNTIWECETNNQYIQQQLNIQCDGRNYLFLTFVSIPNTSYVYMNTFCFRRNEFILIDESEHSVCMNAK